MFKNIPVRSNQAIPDIQTTASQGQSCHKSWWKINP